MAEDREKVKLMEEKKKAELQHRLEGHKKGVVQQLAKTKNQQEALKQQEARFAEFIQRPDITALLETHKKQLEHVFGFGVNRGRTPQSTPGLTLPEFSKLCLVFGVVPELASTEDMKRLFFQSVQHPELAPAPVLPPIKSPSSALKDAQALDYNVRLVVVSLRGS
jgi:hypothetical protein